MRKLFFVLLSCMICILMSSCYNTRIIVGDVNPRESLVMINKEWNHHLIFGLVPLDNATMKAAEYTNQYPNYVVKTNMSFLNMVVSEITFGIYAPTQTTYYVPLRDVSNYRMNYRRRR